MEEMLVGKNIIFNTHKHHLLSYHSGKGFELRYIYYENEYYVQPFRDFAEFQDKDNKWFALSDPSFAKLREAMKYLVDKGWRVDKNNIFLFETYFPFMEHDFAIRACINLFSKIHYINVSNSDLHITGNEDLGIVQHALEETEKDFNEAMKIAGDMLF